LTRGTPWGRVWECPGVIDLVERVERRIGTPLA
jgi:hypothetical protein